MYVTYDKAENARVISDCKWIAKELNTDFDEACCDDFANIVHTRRVGRKGEEK